MTWPEVDAYLARSTGIIIGSGSMEQHGPIGLIGTDAICADSIATEAAVRADAIAAPALFYTPAPFNTSFPGTVSVSAELYGELAVEIFNGLAAQGFRSIYVLNGHGANLEPLEKATARVGAARIHVRSWWSFPPVQALRDEWYGEWEGMHATPSEVAVTQHVTGIIHKGAETPPQKLSADYIREHAGDRHGPPDEHRASFPDGRVGSHSALAAPEHGRQLFEAAADAVAEDYRAFLHS